jgi:hypothetical protein
MSWMANSYVGSYIENLIIERKTAKEAKKGINELDKLMFMLVHLWQISWSI